MRVLVVDDSAFMRRAISVMLGADPAIEVVGTARNGKEGVEKALALNPDVITLDIEMPEMDGLTALREIRRLCPEPKPAVLMCSTLTSAGSHEALKAMRFGAADVIAKDPGAFGAGADVVKAELLAKVRSVGEGVVRKRAELTTIPKPAPEVAPPRPIAKARPAPLATPLAAPAIKPSDASRLPKALSLSGRAIDLVVIGSSTGGPPVLEHILTNLPADFPAPVVVAQHMPAMFTKSMAERLDEMGALSVIQGAHEMPVRAGTVYILPGGLHGRVLRGTRPGTLRLDVSDQPATALYRPSVNELFASAASACGKGALGVMLTGMGDDGLVGAKLLHAAGGITIAQDQATCVVYGMPRVVVDAGVAAAALSPTEIVKALTTIGTQTQAPPGTGPGEDHLAA